MRSFWKYTFFLLFLITLLIWISVFVFPENKLKLVTCDVGQGDAILSIYGEIQILIDGGPDRKVLECLSKYLPFWDRQIELVFLSHPQKDHFGGLIDVIRTYDVDYLVTLPIDSSTQEWEVLKNMVGSMGVKVINPKAGQKIRIGLIHLDIFWPSEDFLLKNLGRKNAEFKEINKVYLGRNSNSFDYLGSENAQVGISELESGVLGAYISKKDLNEFSIVAVLRFKNFDALFTGDISSQVSDWLASHMMVNNLRPIEYIKIPHHGSKNGLTESLLNVVKPKVAVISVGSNNPYSHPHSDLVKMLEDRDIRTLRTDREGDIVIESDGEDVWIRK